MKLSDKIEAASAGSRELDAEIVMLAYERGWPMDPIYPGPINYDPELWQERYGFSPTTSLDAAISIGLEDFTPQQLYIQFMEAVGRWSALGHIDPATLPLFICAAALRARGM